MVSKNLLFLGLVVIVLISFSYKAEAGAASEVDETAWEETEEDLELKIVKPKKPKVKKPNVTKEDEEEAEAKAKIKREKVHQLEADLKNNNIVLKPKCPGFKNSIFRRPRKSTLKKGERAEIKVDATKAIAKKKKLSKKQRKYGFLNIELGDTSFGTCFKSPKCNFSSKYRTIDGSCNNRKNPKWGQAETAFIRLLYSDYGDGVDSPRLASDDKYLPSARIVSSKGIRSKNKPSKDLTHMVMQWGQFLDHDITFTPASGNENFTITCCADETTKQSFKLHPACFPISTTNDKFFRNYNIDCMEFVRSLAGPRRDCAYGTREQLNQITAFIDASNVYGSSEKEISDLREFKGGRMKVNKQNYTALLPPQSESEGCESKPNRPCFKAGDARVNEQPDLAIMHTLWVRQHNLIADGLAEVNPGWNDEILFQEARRIVGAQMQHITYNEWLPIILGKSFMKKNKMAVKKNGYSNTYDKKVDPSISNAFATAAYRFGHTLIQPKLDGYSDAYKRTSRTPLSEVFFSPSGLYDPGRFNSLVRGLAIQRMQRFDNNVPTEVTDKLFKGDNPSGLDLVALNVQRGRDHGLPSYVKYRELCGFGKVRRFSDLKRDISSKNINILRKIYKSVEDIDLFLAGMMETPKSNAVVGRTFRCIIGDQFQRLKFGDRFYYENGKFNQSRFTKKQLAEIKKTRLSTIVCQNTGVKKLQVKVFKKSSGKKNKKFECTNLKKFPKLDLKNWMA